MKKITYKSIILMASSMTAGIIAGRAIGNAADEISIEETKEAKKNNIKCYLKIFFAPIIAALTPIVVSVIIDDSEDIKPGTWLSRLNDSIHGR